jgi:hypothetical protein
VNDDNPDAPIEGSSVVLPDTVQGCRDRLMVLQDEAAAIRIQIATVDLRRQAEKKALDPDWFHRAGTALRFKRREMALLQAEIQRLTGGNPRDTFKDALIGVLRADYDEQGWAQALERARQAAAAFPQAEVRHG